jgi:hypothetical protein
MGTYISDNIISEKKFSNKHFRRYVRIILNIKDHDKLVPRIAQNNSYINDLSLL